MLTPVQIGQIAAYIETALQLNPCTAPEENPECEAAPDNYMEDWEKCLKDLVDVNPNLPSYEEVECDLCLDFLVHYYGNQNGSQ